MEDGIFKFMVYEKELLPIKDDSLIIDIQTNHFLSAKENNNIFDVLEIFNSSDMDIVPVTGNGNKYLGSITRKTILKHLSVLCDVSTPGSIIHIEMNHHDLMVSELAKLAEQNSARIVNLFTFEDKKTEKLQVLIKVNQEDAISYLKTLERYHYNIIAYYHHNEINNEDVQQRLEELLFYLEM